MVVPGAAPGTTAAVIDLTGEEPRVVRMMVGSEGLLVPPPPSVDPYPRGWLPAAFVADRIPRLPTLPQRSGQLHLGAAENTPLSPLSGYMASAVETGGLRWTGTPSPLPAVGTAAPADVELEHLTIATGKRHSSLAYEHTMLFGSAQKPGPIDERKCYQCDYTYLCNARKEHEGFSHGNWHKMQGSYWTEMVEKYCDPGSPDEPARKARMGEDVFNIKTASEATPWRNKHNECCLPSVVNAAPGFTGTTPLASYLAGDSRFTTGIAKEHNWFVGNQALLPDATDEELLREYAHHFPAEHGALGVDMSTSYYGVGLQGGIQESRFARLKSLLPDLRVLVAVKNPLDRMFQVFKEMVMIKHPGPDHPSLAESYDAWVKFRAEGIPLPAAVTLRRPNCCWDVDMTCYTQLELWLAHYRGQLLLIPSKALDDEDHVDYHTNLAPVYSEILDFIGVGDADDGNAAALAHKVHKSANKKRNANREAWPSTRKYLWEKGKFTEQLQRVEGMLCADGWEGGAEGVEACRLWWRHAHGCPDGFATCADRSVVG
eukprot:COSAG05_NODE_3374_length_2104_cov_1.845387_1_plen_544_part_00